MQVKGSINNVDSREKSNHSASDFATVYTHEFHRRLWFWYWRDFLLEESFWLVSAVFLRIVNISK